MGTPLAECGLRMDDDLVVEDYMDVEEGHEPFSLPEDEPLPDDSIWDYALDEFDDRILPDDYSYEDLLGSR